MNSIMGFAELAMDKTNSRHVKDYLGKITDSTKWLLRIINDILDISKIESGRMSIENVPFDLHDDDELQKKLRLKFVKENQDRYTEFTAAITSGDIPLAHRLAHTLKTNEGMIKMNALQNAAAEMEDQLKDGITPTEEQMISIETALYEVLAELAPLIDESAENVEAENLSPIQVQALFEKLEPMLENINPECANLLDELRSVPGVEALVWQIEDYDFDSAMKTLSILKKEWTKNHG